MFIPIDKHVLNSLFHGSNFLNLFMKQSIMLFVLETILYRTHGFLFSSFNISRINFH